MLLLKDYNIILFITTLIYVVNNVYASRIPVVDPLLGQALGGRHQHKNKNVRRFELDITQARYDPDCSGYTGSKLLINGQLPGPPIEVTQGDHVEILVRNNLPQVNGIKFSAFSAMGGLSNDITIHIHGIRQIGSNEADGVPFLTQDPIPAGDSFLYEFQVTEQAGTYFYHAHVGLDAESVFGAFIVYESEKARPKPISNNGKSSPLVAGPYRYHEERTIMLSEWWHKTADEVCAEILGPNFAGVPEADSILINGRTVYQGSAPTTAIDGNLDVTTLLNKANNPLSLLEKRLLNTCEGYTTINLDPAKTYRVRVIGSNVFQTLNLAIAGHELTVMEVDGTLIKPRKVPYLEVAPGQRFSILIEPSNRQGDFAINTIHALLGPGEDPSSNGLAVLRYTASTGNSPRIQEQETTTSQVPTERFEFPQENRLYWFWDDMEPAEEDESDFYAELDEEPSRTLFVKMQSGTLSGGEFRWFINNVTFMDPSKTILTSIREGKRPLPDYDLVNPITGYDEKLGTYPIKKGEIIDFVLQNTRAPDQPCRSHPWHMHGHSFYSLAHGADLYDHEDDMDVRTVSNPFLRDVLTLYPAESRTVEETSGLPATEAIPCGWTKIRFLADNPGIWAMHCHNTPHMIMGMMLALELGAEELRSTR
ncbi:Cupredoxin [Circinella umbellata]|nr:Cupredoxin [Circinella umbellata]